MIAPILPLPDRASCYNLFMPSPELVSDLKGLLAFRDLPDADLEKIVETADVLTLSPDEEMLVEGAPESPWHLLVSGSVRLYQVFGEKERQDTGRLLRIGDFFGADQVLYARTARWKIKAMAASKLLVVPSAKIAEFLRKMPAFKDGPYVQATPAH